MTPARVLLVDDSAFVRRATARMLEPLAGVEVAGTASNGDEAVRQVCALRPDLVILDLQMPGLGGLEALDRIMAECPTPVLLLSSLAQEGADITLRALEAGAVDFVDKSGAAMDIHSLAPLLREKVLAVLGSHHLPGAEGAARAAPPAVPAPGRAGGYDVIAIGCSTGGPRALAEVVPALPAGLCSAVLVAQHMPAGFTATLAERLGRRAALPVAEAAHGDPVLPGRVLIAPGGRQMEMEPDGQGGLRVRVWDDATRLHRPSVDALLLSVARYAGARSIGVVLTGMGSDGAEGLARIRAVGGRTLVESAETAVIDGMPAAARPHAERSVPLPEVAGVLADLSGVAP